MKTFTDYINEKQNFIFGGKAGLTGKEFDVRKTLNELRPGDDLYHIIVKNEKHNYKISRIDHCTYASTLEGGRMSRLFVKEDGLSWAIDTSECKFPIGIASSHDDLYFMLTTYEPTEDEIAEAIERYSKIHESANFVFGGKSNLTGKEYGVDRFSDAPDKIKEFLKKNKLGECHWEKLTNKYTIAENYARRSRININNLTVYDMFEYVMKYGHPEYLYYNEAYKDVKIKDIDDLEVWESYDMQFDGPDYEECIDVHISGDDIILFYVYQ